MNFESEMQALRSQSSGQEICVGNGLDQMVVVVVKRGAVSPKAASLLLGQVTIGIMKCRFHLYWYLDPCSCICCQCYPDVL